MKLLSRIGGPIVKAITGATSLIMRALRLQGDGRGRADRRRDPRGDQRGRGDRRPRTGGRVDCAARVSARRSARGRDHDAARRHRVGRRGHHARRAARVSRLAQPHRIRRLQRRPRQRARHGAGGRTAAGHPARAARIDLRSLVRDAAVRARLDAGVQAARSVPRVDTGTWPS